jgi:hypothetical protein
VSDSKLKVHWLPVWTYDTPCGRTLHPDPTKPGHADTLRGTRARYALSSHDHVSVTCLVCLAYLRSQSLLY